MSAQINSQGKNERKYLRVYNTGVEKNLIFKDQEDYDIFTAYLKEYLSEPANPEQLKKTFTIGGKSYKGTPHLPKNYHKKIELIAYKLVPEQYDLVLRIEDPKLVAAFMRSLFTRYSIYFNKKHKRKGMLFQGPYKSKSLDNHAILLSEIKSLHDGQSKYSSAEEYQGNKLTPWLNVYYNHENHTNTPKESRKLLEFAFAVVIFMVLLGLGIRNIHVSTLKASRDVSDTPPAALESQPIASPIPKVMITINITDGSKTVNIRTSASTNSDKVGEASNGDSFELVSKTTKWYEIKLNDQLTGFVSEKYVQE